MSTPIRNNTPRVIFNGFKDESQQALVAELEQTPIHLALLYLLAQRGPEYPVLCGPNGDLGRIFGSDTLNVRSKFFTHQTEMAKTITAEANAVLIKRLFPTDSATAGLTLVATIKRKLPSLTTEGITNRRARDAFGAFLSRANGDALYINDDAVIPGTITGIFTPTFTTVGVFEPASLPVGVVAGETYQIQGMAGEYQDVFDEDVNNYDYVTFTESAPSVIDGITLIHSHLTMNEIENGELGSAVQVPEFLALKWEWVPVEYADGDLVDSQTKIGLTTSGDYQTITIPVKTMWAPSQGEYGNNIASCVYVDNGYSTTVIEENKTLVLKARFDERTAVGKPWIPLDNLKGAASVNFTYLPTAYNESTGETLFVNNIVDYYNDDGVLSGRSPTIGPIGEVLMHGSLATAGYELNTSAAALAAEFTAFGPANHMDLLYSIIAKAEAVGRANELSDVNLGHVVGDFTEATDKMLLNIFDGIGSNGVPYYGFKVGSTLATSYPTLDFQTLVSFDKNQRYPLGGGEDGTTTNEMFEDLVKYEINSNYNNPEYDLTDMARYPFSALYDSGFSDEGGVESTKDTLAKWLSYRPDVHVTIGTHAAGEKLDIATEEGRASFLLENLQQYAESEEYGTSCVRAVIVAHSGDKIQGTYRGRLPLTFELAQKRARYLGAGNGVAKYGNEYSKLPGSAIENFKNVNNVFMTYGQRETLWTSGVNFVQFADRSTLFFPALETVYDPRNSVLTSELLMQIACDVTKQCDKTWKFMTGDVEYTPEQFLERSNQKLAELVAGKYGNRVQIVPNAYYTAADTARGYSWVMDAIIYGNVMKTTATVNVIIRRSFDQ